MLCGKRTDCLGGEQCGRILSAVSAPVSMVDAVAINITEFLPLGNQSQVISVELGALRVSRAVR